MLKRLSKAIMEEKMKKAYALIMPLLCGTALVFGLTSCDNNLVEPVVDTFTVSYYDGSTVIHTEEVENGEVAPNWDPTSTVTNKEFFGWFGEPTLTHEYDFTTPVTDDLSIFGSFVGYQKDNRQWAIAGSGASAILKSSNWGKVFTEDHYMVNESTDSRNVYTYEVNLFVNDQFQFTDPIFDETNETYSWGHQRGGGYLVNPSKDNVEYFSVGGGLGSDNYTSNITALVEGRYKFTLTTYPAGDFQKDDTTNTYDNRNYYDTLEWERLGDPTEELAETEISFFIKGALITSWANLQNDHTLMSENEGIYTLNNVYLKAEDEFMFASIVKTIETGEVSEGNEYIKANNLTESAKELVSGTSNMKVNETGYYSFTYDYEAQTLDVVKNDSYTPVEASYYVDGNFNNRNWGIEESLKLVADSENPEVLELATPITVAKADEEMGIQYYNAELDSPYVDFFGAKYVAVASENYDLTKNNIVFKVPGEYNISINTYSHIITISLV